MGFAVVVTRVDDFSTAVPSITSFLRGPRRPPRVAGPLGFAIGLSADTGFALSTCAFVGLDTRFALGNILRSACNAFGATLPPTIAIRANPPPGMANNATLVIIEPAVSPPAFCRAAALGFTFAPFLFRCAISIFLFSIWGWTVLAYPLHPIMCDTPNIVPSIYP